MPPPFATGFVRPALTRFCGFPSFNSLSLSVSSSVVDFSGHALTFPYVHRCGLRSLRSRIATLLSALSRFRLCFRISFSSLFCSSFSLFFFWPVDVCFRLSLFSTAFVVAFRSRCRGYSGELPGSPGKTTNNAGRGQRQRRHAKSEEGNGSSAAGEGRGRDREMLGRVTLSDGSTSAKGEGPSRKWASNPNPAKIGRRKSKTKQRKADVL